MNINSNDFETLLKRLRFHGLCLTYFGDTRPGATRLPDRLKEALGKEMAEVIMQSAFTSESFGLDVSSRAKINAIILDGSPQLYEKEGARNNGYVTNP